MITDIYYPCKPRIYRFPGFLFWVLSCKEHEAEWYTDKWEDAVKQNIEHHRLSYYYTLTLVHKTGAETVAGGKTFSVAPLEAS